MANQVEIYCNNTQQKHFISEATKLKAVAEALYISLPNPVVGALVNNELRDLEFKVFKPKTIQFIDYSHVDGQRMYSRSLIFVLRKAVHELLGVAIEVHHSVSNGLYVELDNKIEITPVIIDQIKQKMQDIIADDFPFTSQIQLTSDVVNEFSRRQMFDKAKIFAQRKQLYTTITLHRIPQAIRTHTLSRRNVTPSTQSRQPSGITTY
jgi:uridine kinase